MTKIIKNTLLVVAFMPLLALAALELNTGSTTSIVSNNNATDTVEQITEDKEVDQAKIELRKIQAAKIDAYYGKYNLPLAGKGMQFVLIAEKYGLPYNFLPAIAMIESTGGKFACYNNPFGWGSCKIKFGSFDEAIETVGKNLGGANPKTARYYADKTVRQKLYFYNGTVIKGYEDKVISVMKKIDATSVNIDTDSATNTVSYYK